MRFENLHAALGPTRALLLEGRKTVRGQAFTHDLVHVHRAQVLLHQTQAQLGVFTQAPLRPLAVRTQGLGANHRHRAVLNDRVALVAVVHPDAKEAVVFPVHHLAEHGGAPVTVRLRRLHDAHLRVVKMPHQ